MLKSFLDTHIDDNSYENKIAMNDVTFYRYFHFVMFTECFWLSCNYILLNILSKCIKDQNNMNIVLNDSSTATNITHGIKHCDIQCALQNTCGSQNSRCPRWWKGCGALWSICCKSPSPFRRVPPHD